MTRIVRTVPLQAPAVEAEVGAVGRPGDRDAEASFRRGKPLEPASAVVRTAQPSRAMHKRPEDDPKPAIVTSASRKRRIVDGPTLPMELPLSRRPAEREGDDYKRLKAATTRRLRGETN